MTQARLRDIAFHAAKAHEFVGEMTLEEFENDDRTVFAVIRALEVVGEAAKAIPPEIRAMAPAVPWRSLAGMRHRLIHHYFGVDREVVSRAAKEETLPLIAEVERLLEMPNELSDL